MEVCWGADVHSGTAGHCASGKCAAAQGQLSSTHGYVQSQDECDFRPRTELQTTMCCAQTGPCSQQPEKGQGNRRRARRQVSLLAREAVVHFPRVHRTRPWCVSSKNNMVYLVVMVP